MPEQSFDGDMPYSVDEFIENIEDSEFNAALEGDSWQCDFCSQGVHYTQNVRVGSYWVDKVLAENSEFARMINERRVMTQMATYCPDCSQRLIYYPCEGFCEARVWFRLDSDRLLKDVEVTDISPRSDGIPWDPRELSESITGIPFDQNAALAGPETNWGPENMVTFFLSVGGGVDIRELVQWDGTLDPKALGRARNEYEKFMKKMQRSGASRKAFNREVRGGDS